MRRTPLLIAVLVPAASIAHAQPVTFAPNVRPLFSATPAAASHMAGESALGHVGRFYTCENGKCRGEGGALANALNYCSATRLPVAADLRAASRISVTIRLFSSDDRPAGLISFLTTAAR